MNSFQISPYMQELMTYSGQLDCYDQCNEILSKFTGVDVSVMQVHRVTDTYGSLLEQQAATEPSLDEEEVMELKPDEAVYAMTDGSMILTREDGWNEVKLGRIFKESECMEVGGERGWIKTSIYEALLGSSKAFSRRFEQKLDAYSCLGKRLIFITDGAIWMKNWLTDAYPNATQILDWFHGCEHLCEFGREYFRDEDEKNKWIEEQKALLYESKTTEVITNIISLATTKESVETSKNNYSNMIKSIKTGWIINNIGGWEQV